MSPAAFGFLIDSLIALMVVCGLLAWVARIAARDPLDIDFNEQDDNNA